MTKADREAKRLLHKMNTMQASLNETSASAKALMPRLDATTARTLQKQLTERAANVEAQISRYSKKLEKLLKEGANPLA